MFGYFLTYMADTQAIKERVDIVQFIQEYLPLKKAGANWKTNCPFHHEKTPSFMVHPEKQIWHCFGCGKGGDVFSFLQEMEGLDFAEALKILADRAGVKLTNTFQNELAKSQKNRIIEINDKAALFYHRFLTEMSAARLALDYLKNKRLLKDTDIAEWQIGYIPDQWDLLTQYMLKKGVGIEDLIAAGLTIKNEERHSYYDRFRGRIMFPIWDVHGNVVGFTGRLLIEKENSGGKYVNTPQSPVYDKSRLLYGLNKAKQEIKSKDLAIIVEGQMDVIACHGANMKNVIAASGTALTDEQVRLLKRYTNNLAVAFDADLAGENAAKRGIDTAVAAGLNVRVITVPAGSGKDADECLKKNPKIWFSAVENAKGIIDWHFEKNLAGLDLHNPRSKQHVADILLGEIAKVPFAVERDAWIRKLSEILSVEPSILTETMKKAVKSKPRIDEKSEKPDPKFVAGGRADLLLNKLWSLIIREPKIFVSLHAYLKQEFFGDEPFRALYDFAEKQYNISASVDFSGLEILNNLNENIIGLLFMQAEKDYADWSVEMRLQEAEIILKEIEKGWKKIVRERLKSELSGAQTAGDTARENEILKNIMELNG